MTKTHQTDPHELPMYPVSEAAHYLSLPPPAIRMWVQGRPGCKPLIKGADRHPILLLSFMNLAELHLLAAIRRKHKISLQKTRKAINWLEKKYGTKHPLLSRELETNGLDLFVRRYGEVINISQDGQIEMRDLMEAALQRIERDANNRPVRLYPFSRSDWDIAQDPKTIMIDPLISGGRPVLAGTGLVVEIIADRFKAGETISELAYDYGRKEEEIEEAIRWEVFEPATVAGSFHRSQLGRARIG